MVKGVAIFFGLLILIGTFYVANIYVTAEDKQDIKSNYNLCESKIGSVGKFISNKVTSGCEDNTYKYYLLSYHWIAYIIGGILLIVGIAGKSNVNNKKETIEEKTRNRICIKCGTETYDKDEFCPKCGFKLNNNIA